jgi:hypothetical protein
MDVPHAREVDHEAVVDRAVAGRVVASAPDRDLEAPGLPEGKGRRNVVRIDASSDRRRAPIDQQVEAETRLLVLAVAFDQQVTRQRVTELVQRLTPSKLKTLPGRKSDRSNRTDLVRPGASGPR